jgi:hypothetical protein
MELFPNDCGKEGLEKNLVVQELLKILIITYAV